MELEGANLPKNQEDRFPVRYWEALEKEVVRPGVKRAGFRGEEALMVMNWLTPGMDTNPHSHPCEQLVYVVKGKMRFNIEGEDIEVGAGGMVRIPPDAVHFGEPIGEEEVLNLDIFAPIRDDYRHLVEYQSAEFAD